MSKADSIKGRIKNIAAAENKPYDYLLMLYMTERLLYRISLSRYKDSLILKGGLLLYTILDDKARVTKDIDLLAKGMTNDLDAISDVFKEICSINIDDSILFDINTIKAERIKEDADYEGVRIKMTAYIDRSRKVLQFDIGFGDIVIPKPVDMEYPSLLDMERPKLKAYSIESVIAEKFEAMIYLADTNSRMKDYYDIYTLSQKFNFEGKVLYRAIKETFKRRHTPLPEIPVVFTESFGKSEQKATQWNAFKRRINSDLDVSFNEIIKSLTIFLQPIYMAILKDSSFNMNWSDKQRWNK